jgi:hypothetical protein
MNKEQWKTYGELLKEASKKLYDAIQEKSKL